MMDNLPKEIIQYAYNATVKKKSPAYIYIDGLGEILNFGGNLDVYGVKNIKVGKPVSDYLLVLAGLFPFEDDYFEIPCINIGKNVFSDIYIFKEKNRYCVLLLDSSLEGSYQLDIRQKVNDLCLLRDEQQILLEKLNKAKNVAEFATRAKSDFLATMSHEIRTPLNGIIGMAEILGETNLTEEQEDFVETINMSGETLLSIINDILDFSKIESGKMDLEENDFSIRKSIEKVFDILSAKLVYKNVKLLSFIDFDVPEIIIGDSIRIRQIILNIVGNAIKFTHKGQIITKVFLKEINDNFIKLSFSIKDSGVGIPKDKLKKIFEAFSQVDSSTTRKFGGTGLGLSISKKLIELMDGNIWVESIEDEGATFYFDINVKYKNESKSILNSEVKEFVGKKAIVLSDNIFSGDIIETLLNKWGMETFLFNLESFSRFDNQKDFDILILDISFISKDQIKTFSKFKDQYKKPIILIIDSNNKIDKTKQNVLFNSLILNPLKHSYLQQTLFNLLSNNNFKNKEIDSNLDINLSGLNVLMAEDDFINQKVATKIFEKINVPLDIVKSGKEVIDKLLNNKYDIVLMDLQMPEMDGFEATEVILSHDGIIEKPIIISMSASNLLEDKNKALSLGMSDFINKPISMVDLINKLSFWNKNKHYSNLNILVAEDDKTNQLVARKIFEKIGIRIDIANNGLEVLEKLISKKYHIIFMDLQMPEMDGFETTKSIYENFGDGRSKIIAMTANVFEEHKKKAFEIGMDDFISKPISISAIKEKIDKYNV